MASNQLYTLHGFAVSSELPFPAIPQEHEFAFENIAPFPFPPSSLQRCKDCIDELVKSLAVDLEMLGEKTEVVFDNWEKIGEVLVSRLRYADLSEVWVIKPQ